MICHALLWLWCSFTLNPAWAQDSLAGISADVLGLPIDHFRFSGNEQTRAGYMLERANLYIGKLITIENLEYALQELRDTDLFKAIQFQAERLENGEITLHILVDERRSWLLLPRASRNGDGDIKYGMRLRMYNLQGADRTLEVLAQHEDEEDGDSNDELRMRYKLPLFPSPYDQTWTLRHIVENKDEEGFENIEYVNQVSFTISRDWNIDFIETPLTVSTGIVLQDRELDEPYPDDIVAREAGQFNRLRLALIFDDEHRDRYRRFGSYYELAVQQGFETLGSDYESTIVEIEAINFHRLNRYDNLNSRFVIEVSNDSPFDYPQYGIGGSSNVRGLESIDERGDARWYANLELIISYRKLPAVAHSFFVDFGNVYDDLEDVDFGDTHYTLGTGIRWKVESFVKTDLFLDYGYDVEEGDGKFYGGTSLNF